MKKIVLILFIVLSAGVWWNVWHIGSFATELTKAPSYLKNNVGSFLLEDKLSYVQEARWNAFGEEKEDTLSRLYYNKAYVLVDNFFAYLTFLSPRMFFQAGDGTMFSPPGVEPIAGLLFFLWVLGIIHLLKKNEFRPIIYSFVFSFLAFLIGRRTLVFLFPVLILYIYISKKGISLLPSYKKKTYITFFGVYGLFILGRVLWLLK